MGSEQQHSGYWEGLMVLTEDEGIELPEFSCIADSSKSCFPGVMLFSKYLSGNIYVVIKCAYM